mmetsp:Transcript_15559/g.36833  ORF Transcript_15559/g.36833 Transcript_15559/m.36833 type:complete len:226 (+) Transcript_15559:272-949(+)
MVKRPRGILLLARAHGHCAVGAPRFSESRGLPQHGLGRHRGAVSSWRSSRFKRLRPGCAQRRSGGSGAVRKAGLRHPTQQPLQQGQPKVFDGGAARAGPELPDRGLPDAAAAIGSGGRHGQHRLAQIPAAWPSGYGGAQQAGAHQDGPAIPQKPDWRSAPRKVPDPLPGGVQPDEFDDARGVSLSRPPPCAPQWHGEADSADLQAAGSVGREWRRRSRRSRRCHA